MSRTPATPSPALTDANQRKLQAILGRGGTVETAVPGMVCWWAGNGIPDGYLACDGSAVSRVAFANLFRALGTKFGAGDGVSTFNLPGPIVTISGFQYVIRT